MYIYLHTSSRMSYIILFLILRENQRILPPGLVLDLLTHANEPGR